MALNLDRPLVLGIESSCDDTACAVVDGCGRVLSSVVSSQIQAHRPFGGVVPEIASREHLSNWPSVSREALDAAGLEMYDVDAVAATRGPGLVGCLLVGLSIGRAVAWGLDCDFHAVHHIEGHLYSPFLSPRGVEAEDVPPRFDGLVVSGGHTSLLEVDAGQVKSLVETRDDAMGEVFDKVGKRLGLAYPQGPRLDALAETGTVSKTQFRVLPPKGDLFFSYSGLKSQALREIDRLARRGIEPPLGEDGLAAPEDDWPQPLRDLAASFRHAAVAQIVDRLRRVHDRRRIDTLAVSGGVAANRLLRRALVHWAEEAGANLRLVPIGFAGDNAAMIAFAALERQRRGLVDDPRRVVVASRLPFG
ncbi:MAG: tRNA (adenosine(37)-N6)-threonylcarbamoyltransferase complex transferase subunit TsaD [Acidobacteriota bacterium]